MCGRVETAGDGCDVLGFLGETKTNSGRGSVSSPVCAHGLDACWHRLSHNDETEQRRWMNVSIL